MEALVPRQGLELLLRSGSRVGREAMIVGLCESLLMFQAIIIWRDEPGTEGKVFLRDIIDLEATDPGADVKAMPAWSA